MSPVAWDAFGLDGLREEPAIDANIRAGDKAAGVVTGQKKRRADEVQIEIGVPIFQRDLLKSALGADGYFRIIATRGVDEDARRAQRFYNGVLRLAKAGGLRGVCGKKNGGTALVENGFGL